MAVVPRPEEGTVAVMVRARPLAPGEGATQQSVLGVVDHPTLVFHPEEPAGPSGGVLPAGRAKNPGKRQRFRFDREFAAQATQEEVFQRTTRDTVLEGYSCSVSAYGATGAGKTYTMLGSEKSPGIIYLTMEELYRRLEARKEQKSYKVLVSYQEKIYKNLNIANKQVMGASVRVKQSSP